MSDEIEESIAEGVMPFYEQAAVQVDQIPISGGIPMGIECISSPDLGIGGVYGTWGNVYSNENLTEFLEDRLGESLSPDEKLNLATLGFVYRHHIPELSPEEHLELEVEVGSRMLKAAAQACGWQPQEVEAVMIGMSGPVSDDYVTRIADRAGIPTDAMVMSVHKACDSSMGALQIALNPNLEENNSLLGRNYARLLEGKKVLVGGIEGLSRFMNRSRDTNALQLFGNGAGVIGVIPGKTMKFLVGKAHEVFDIKGVLAVRMYYPYRGSQPMGGSLIEVTEENPRHVRVAGKMHEPENNESVEMAGPMGMVKLFVRSGVQVVSDVYQAYRQRLDELGESSKSIATVIVHHANYKINKLISAQLAKGGIELPMPWVLSEFGNVSAASNMIAFLRKLSTMRPGDHILFDGFGAGTYYDVFAVELGEA
jgi:3-oxoacyl-[acyl-carrier-protein] synthase III